MEILELAILADADAGETSLTARILFETGDVGSAGGVDRRTTRAEPFELKRARGVAITSAVGSSHPNDHIVDTPGHVDLVVDAVGSSRAPDGVVLLVAAGERVRARTRSPVRAVRAAKLPLLVLVHKVDRLAAGAETRAFR